MADREDYAKKIWKGREALTQGELDYSRGRIGLSTLNKLYRDDADNLSDYRECAGGRVPDRRGR